MNVTDATGKSVLLDRKIGEGGEGGVFLVPQQPEIVAKIYSKPLAHIQIEKLQAMIDTADPALSAIAAWPQSLIYRNGIPAGFTMPRLTSQYPLHELFGPKRRQSLFPSAQWKYLIHTGVNLASGFHALHKRNVVVGDVNSNNVVVYENSIIRFIDCDSFQIARGSELYLCTVGVPEYQPPELQNRNLSEVRRTQQQDLFGLAILIFQLLFVGKHPFSGVLPKTAVGGAAPADNIMQGRFFYSDDAIRQGLRPPPGSPAIGLVTPEMGRMFNLAFGASPMERPSADQWRAALSDLETRTVQCAANPSHWFNTQNGSCPWCALEAGSRAVYFIVPILSPTGTVDESIWQSFSNAEVERLWREICAVRAPELQDASIKKQRRYRGQDLPHDLSKQLKRYASITAAVAFVASISTALLNNAFAIVGWLLFLVILARRPDGTAEYARRRSTMERATEEYNYAFNEWRRAAENARFVELKASLARVNQEMMAQRSNYDASLKQMEANRERDERNAYMDSNTIANAKISGIGPKTKSVLLSFGYETALDINIGVTNISGIKYAKYAALEAWRRSVESGFRFDRQKGLSPKVLQPFKARYVQARIAGRGQLTNGAAQLTGIATEIEQRRPFLQQRASKLADQMWQAEADFKKLKSGFIKH